MKIVIALVLALVVGGSVHAANPEFNHASDYVRIAETCGKHPALRQHFRAVIQDGETQSDWLTHMGPICRTYALHAGRTLNDALDDEEVPYTREIK